MTTISSAISVIGGAFVIGFLVWLLCEFIDGFLS